MTDPIVEAVRVAIMSACDSAQYGEDPEAIVRAAIAPLEARGYTIVPFEPTEKMMDAARDCLDNGEWIGNAYWREWYRAMITARPKELIAARKDAEQS